MTEQEEIIKKTATVFYILYTETCAQSDTSIKEIPSKSISAEEICELLESYSYRVVRAKFEKFEKEEVDKILACLFSSGCACKDDNPNDKTPRYGFF